MTKIIITIDGYSSCGKSTLARQLSASLQYKYIDSGAMYRAITLYFLQQEINWNDESQLQNALRNIQLKFQNNSVSGKPEIYMNDENVDQAIRDMIVADKVSEVAALGAVRDYAVFQQRQMGLQKGIVMDGRDIGTIVFPEAEMKFFMTADIAVRIKRRFDELYKKDPGITVNKVKENLAMRDYVDSNRVISPLRMPEDAVIIDNTNMTIKQQLDFALDIVKKRMVQIV
jgi:CMP/dCMP kinase